MTFFKQLIKILGEPDQFDPAFWKCGCKCEKITKGEKFTPCLKHKHISKDLKF